LRGCPWQWADGNGWVPGLASQSGGEALAQSGGERQRQRQRLLPGIDTCAWAASSGVAAPRPRGAPPPPWTLGCGGGGEDACAAVSTERHVSSTSGTGRGAGAPQAAGASNSQRALTITAAVSQSAASPPQTMAAGPLPQPLPPSLAAAVRDYAAAHDPARDVYFSCGAGYLPQQPGAPRNGGSGQDSSGLAQGGGYRGVPAASGSPQGPAGRGDAEGGPPTTADGLGAGA
jgi:hypothetical protein